MASQLASLWNRLGETRKLPVAGRISAPVPFSVVKYQISAKKLHKSMKEIEKKKLRKHETTPIASWTQASFKCEENSIVVFSWEWRNNCSSKTIKNKTRYH